MFFVAFPKVLVFFVLLTGECLLFSAFGQKNPLRTPLNEWPMIQAHDAATTYLGSGIVNRWAKTQQDGGILGMLDCAARSFDWRPHLLRNGTLVMHHSFDVIDYAMSEAMDELIKWSSKNFPEASCYDREIVICGYNLQPENYS